MDVTVAALITLEEMAEQGLGLMAATLMVVRAEEAAAQGTMVAAFASYLSAVTCI